MTIEALAQWVDTPIHVVLSVAAQDVSFCLGLTDELGCGTRSLYYRSRWWSAESAGGEARGSGASVISRTCASCIW
jgi:hypothetical protein